MAIFPIMIVFFEGGSISTRYLKYSHLLKEGDPTCGACDATSSWPLQPNQKVQTDISFLKVILNKTFSTNGDAEHIDHHMVSNIENPVCVVLTFLHRVQNHSVTCPFLRSSKRLCTSQSATDNIKD